MRALISDSQASWDDYMSAVTFALSSAKRRAINFSPYYLMFIRRSRIELDILDNDRAPGQKK